MTSKSHSGPVSNPSPPAGQVKVRFQRRVASPWQDVPAPRLRCAGRGRKTAAYPQPSGCSPGGGFRPRAGTWFYKTSSAALRRLISPRIGGGTRTGAIRPGWMSSSRLGVHQGARAHKRLRNRALRAWQRVFLPTAQLPRLPTLKTFGG